jgi:MFS family permease
MPSSEVAKITDQDSRSGFLRLLGNRNYALLWWGQLVSELGNRFHWIAISLWIYSETRSASAVSIAISSMFAGSLLVGLWAGVVVDYFDRKRIMVFSDVARAVLVALIPFLMTVNIWLVYLDLMLISTATAFFRPAIFSVVPQVVRRSDLLPANSFFSAMDTGTEIVGPALAGIVAVMFGYAPLLYMDSATYLVSALCILGMSIPSVTAAVGKVSLSSVWDGVKEGLRYIRSDSLQWGLFILLFPVTLVGASLNALQTPLAKGVIGISDSEFGSFQAVWGFGFVAASLMLGWYGARFRRHILVLGGYFLVFAATALMGFSTSFLTLVAAAFAVGFANTMYYVGLSTTIMEYSPQGVLGRVISTRQLAIGVVRVVAPLLLGLLADAVGIRETIVAMAVAGTVITMVILSVLPAARRFEAGPFQVNETRSALWRVLVGPVNPQFDHTQQHRLNFVSILIAWIAWLGLLFAIPAYAVGLLVLVPLFVLFGSLARKRGWLRAPEV